MPMLTDHVLRYTSPHTHFNSSIHLLPYMTDITNDGHFSFYYKYNIN